MTGSVMAPAETRGPFGTPDGSRADIEAIEHDFVPLDAKPAFGALATRADDASVRVIVGKMGAGKTVYMRRLYSHQDTNPGVYADRPQQDLPQTSLVVKACHWFPARLMTEKWMLLWGRAILRSLATHILASKEMRATVPDDVLEELGTHYRNLIGEFRRPRSIYTEVSEVIADHNSHHHLSEFLGDPAWADLEYTLAEALRLSRPAFFYLDAVDDMFVNAPLYWLRCHEGLFLQVMQLLRGANFGGRLHVVICVRDLVLSEVLRSEHGPRYHDEPHVCVLNWTRAAIEYLLREKLQRLPPEYQMAPGLAEPITAWLGTNSIYNERRGIDENLLDYIVRHTRLIPRDVVSIGNALSRAVQEQKDAGRSEIPPETLRHVVSAAAKRFGDSQLAQCASQITADMMPRNAVPHGYSDAYLSNQEYTATVRDHLKNVISVVGADRFSAATLATMDELGKTDFDGHPSISAVLWQNGLLGYVDNAATRFYSVADAGDLDIPRDAEQYVFHPCVLDAVRNVRSVGPHPVYPYSPD